MTVPAMIICNSLVADDDVADPRGVVHVRKVMAELLKLIGCATPEDAAQRVRVLMGSIGVAPSFAELDIPLEGLGDLVAGSINWERMNNNPRRLTAEMVSSLIDEIG